MPTRKTKVRCARCPYIWEVQGIVNKKTKKDITCPNCGYILPAVLARYLYETRTNMDSTAENLIHDEGTVSKTRDKGAFSRFKGTKSVKGYQ
jgi:adenine-specific DNA methylase